MSELLDQKTQPFNIEAEISVLGSMLLDNECIPKVIEMLTKEDFYKTGHQHLFDAIVGLAEKGKVDLVILKEELNTKRLLEKVGGSEYLMNIEEEVPIAANVEYYAKIVRNKAISREIIVICAGTLNDSYGDEKDPESILEESQESLSGIQKKFSMGIEVSRPNFSEKDLDEFFSLRPTGVKHLDEVIGGGLSIGLTFVGARTHMGKTSLVLRFLGHIALNYGHSLYYGTRISKEIIYSRLLCARNDIRFNDLKNHTKRKGIKNLGDAMKETDKIPMYLHTADEELSVMSIISSVKQKKAEFGELGVIIVENLQQLSHPKKFKSDKERIDKIVSMLKTLALQVKTPVVVSSQIKREDDDAEDNRPAMERLKGSGNIEEEADLIILNYIEESDPKSIIVNGDLEITKGGNKIKVLLSFDRDCFNWIERKEEKKVTKKK